MTSPVLSPIAASALVAGGGALGALARYQAGRVLTHALTLRVVDAFPWPTLVINLAGSLAMGLLVGWFARHGAHEYLRLLLGVGVLGGFTTFSAFSLEMMLLVERGHAGLAAGYAALSVVAGLAALWLGLAVMRGAA
ncbi:fluoride efflux transporter CrcB [Erythrobacter tepidarius]|uniref:fluoride efflux transporter CrcB n=1 Tax=Erythrobacter tepidarius TaxID=60454 RepID=UPI000A39F27D|nr:fluoride efflux transporter CrcB [Erythrobacter tepidarius]